MVSVENKQIVKIVIWTSAFKTLKELVITCPKLYFIKKEYKIILYTDASDCDTSAVLASPSKSSQIRDMNS